MNSKITASLDQTRRSLAIAAGLLATAFGLANSRAANLSSYSENFESLDQTSPTTLNDWLIYANVFSPDLSTYYYGYGPFLGPNNGTGFCQVTTGQGGSAQGSQGLVIYSDYNNSGQATGNQIEANTFQEETITQADLGPHVFRFDAKKGDLVAPSTARAFIKVLDPNNSYQTTTFLPLNTGNLPVDWGTYSISINIDQSMVGQLIQFGFAATASNYVASGVHYDNVSFGIEAPAPPVITGVTKVGSLVSVMFPTKTGSTYDLLKSTDGMATFNPVPTQPAITGDGTSKTATDSAASGTSAFYRIRRQTP